MDSEVTLVNLPPPTSYFLSSTDLRDAVIYAQPGVPLYRITSDTKHIKIYDGTNTDRVTAILHRRDLLSDTISFPQRHNNGSMSTMSIQRWLKRSKLADGTPTFTVDTEYGPYVWKSVSRYRQKVFADYDLEKPVASCYLHLSHPPIKPAFILQSVGEPLRDDIVVAYIIQRHRVIMENKALDLFVGLN
ncbi:hypothetical protein L210DRAFT_3546632 [Boletus edulis BED1]|uniref:DUF6593 domain-containing protein n=1 Tax=Boletus edulis BED1 TaxID=1328754 RepID=A0AAD4GDZ9_BOLED|nr:hypothetical protein L210DRAFT_3546632 [Boletus edulis BED1]